ncbi:MAG: outer membrane beta-barrel family protein [Candidatus Marinimicrobia bacterium]|nr:outer membrane beta-barrel family protein [Candidatus Neomarinimicrobiota bacterium]
MKKINVFIYLCLLISLAMAQPPVGNRSGRPAIGKLTGIVVDDRTEKPIEYAATTILNVQDSSIVTGTITDQNGVFIIEKIPLGQYIVKISFIGYKSRTIGEVVISPKKTEVNLGTIRIQSTVLDMKSVTVTGTMKQIEYNLDKKIIKVDNEVATMGGTALDVMQNIPSVTVDLDGNVSLRGSSNVTMLIDNHPSQIISLDQIPASMIDRVEVITNPSARYDPEGMSGIINIVMKKKQAPGINGMVLLNAGTKDKYNGSLNLNYRVNRLNLYVNYDGRFSHMNNWMTRNRESTFADSVSYLDQDENSRRKMQFSNFKAGGDYILDPFQTISFSVTRNMHGMGGNETTDYETHDGLQNLTNAYTRYVDEIDKSYGSEAALNYKKTFARELQEFTADFFYSNRTGDDNMESIQEDSVIDRLPIETIIPSLQNTYTDSKGRVTTFQTDYTYPFLNGLRIETGYKGTFRLNDSDYQLENNVSDEWVVDSAATNHFIYTEQIHAVYGILAGTRGLLQYQGGIRFEYADNSSDQETTDETFSNSLFGFFPSIHLQYTLTERQGLQFSYSRRVNRPRSWSLNPFINYEDPQNLSAGNPNLKPEYIDVVEIGHSFDSRPTSVNTTLFYRQVTGMITGIMKLQTDGTTMTTFKNLNNGKSVGLELVVNQQIFKWWRFNANYSYFLTELSGPGLQYAQATRSDGWTLKVNSFTSLSKRTNLQVSLFYFSPTISGGDLSRQGHGGHGGGMTQGKTKGNLFANVGIKHEFLDGKLTATLRVSDLLKSTKMGMTTVGENFISTSQRRREGQVFYLALSYKINEQIREKERKSKNEEIEFEDEDF